MSRDDVVNEKYYEVPVTTLDHGVVNITIDQNDWNDLMKHIREKAKRKLRAIYQAKLEAQNEDYNFHGHSAGNTVKPLAKLAIMATATEFNGYGSAYYERQLESAGGKVL